MPHHNRNVHRKGCFRRYGRRGYCRWCIRNLQVTINCHAVPPAPAAPCIVGPFRGVRIDENTTYTFVPQGNENAVRVTYWGGGGGGSLSTITGGAGGGGGGAMLTVCGPLSTLRRFNLIVPPGGIGEAGEYGSQNGGVGGPTTISLVDEQQGVTLGGLTPAYGGGGGNPPPGTVEGTSNGGGGGGYVGAGNRNGMGGAGFGMLPAGGAGGTLSDPPGTANGASTSEVMVGNLVDLSGNTVAALFYVPGAGGGTDGPNASGGTMNFPLPQDPRPPIPGTTGSDSVDGLFSGGGGGSFGLGGTVTGPNMSGRGAPGGVLVEYGFLPG